MKLLIRVDASASIGTGHVMRCLALAQATLKDELIAFLMGATTPALESLLSSEGIMVARLGAPLGSNADALETINHAKLIEATWVVVDGYHFGETYQKLIKDSGFKLLIIDDYGHATQYWADLILNQNLGVHSRLYHHRKLYTNLLLGPRFALLRKEFWAWQGFNRQISTSVGKLLITLGGADSENVTFKVLQALRQIECQEIDVVVVVGGSNPHLQELQATIQNLPFAIVLKQNVANMPTLMAWADIAITAGGSTCWEIAFMGLPSLIIIQAQNQQEIAKNLDGIGSAKNIGWHTLLPESLIQGINQFLNDSALRSSMSARAKQLVDGEGVDRVLMHLREQNLRLRTIREDECDLQWQWANDPVVRARSFSSDPISWEKHAQWFQSKIHSPSCKFYIAINAEDIPIGSIRYELERHEAIVSICVDSKYRGQGYGHAMIELGSRILFSHSPIKKINAYIQPHNHASIRAFQKAGFACRGTILFQQGQSYIRALQCVKEWP
jgi:UDP-2,4-diacetamido-2,4,6-trideoxy-beta-L-altropyranose hydrolase